MFSTLCCHIFLFLFFPILQFQVSSNKELPNWNDVKKACGKNLSVQDISTILHTKFVPTKEDQKCFLECMYNRMGIIKDGKLNWETGARIAKQKFGDDHDKLNKLEAAFNTCNEKLVVDTKEKCALGRLLRDCFYNNPPTANFQKY